MSELPQSRQDRDAPPGRSPRRIGLALLPLLAFAIVAGFLYEGLSLRPRDIPSALIDKPAPDFDLPPIPGRPPGLATADLTGQVSLVNVFASWCAACRIEHPLLMRLAEEDAITLHGLNYKDDAQAAAGWLRRHGDPYGRVGFDNNGRVGIDWGVYGVPETFIVDARGRIVYKHIGPIQNGDWERIILPIVRRLEAGAS